MGQDLNPTPIFIQTDASIKYAQTEVYRNTVNRLNNIIPINAYVKRFEQSHTYLITMVFFKDVDDLYYLYPQDDSTSTSKMCIILLYI